MACQDGTIRLKLEGRLVGLWVDLLREHCQNHQNQSDLPLLLDLSEVRFASREGLDLLCTLENQRIRCTRRSPLLKALAQQMERAISRIAS
jgi:anti-anti-sigma regulatory factor